MTKLNTPLLSFGSTGSIANAITIQKRHGYHYARTKPVPANPRSLPQMYQRWLYEDYAYLWTQQSNATKRLYAANGVRYHLTGFQYWMKNCLATWPGILGWWPLDEKQGAIAHDRSAHHSNGTIYGASPAAGVIDGGYHFDGLNDKISFGIPTHLTMLTAKSISFTYQPEPPPSAYAEIYYSGLNHSNGGDGILTYQNLRDIAYEAKNTLGVSVGIGFGVTPGKRYRITFTWNGATIRAWRDADEAATPVAFTGTLASNQYPHELGTWLNTRWYKGMIDNLIIYNIALDPVIIKRWSERRYPL